MHEQARIYYKMPTLPHLRVAQAAIAIGQIRKVWQEGREGKRKGKKTKRGEREVKRV